MSCSFMAACVTLELSNYSSLRSETFGSWCARGDLNSHPLRDQILSLARLPFRHARGSSGSLLKRKLPRAASAQFSSIWLV